MSQVTQLLYFIGERERIRIRRANGEPPPWTEDKILQQWSFCNVTTRWIAEHWRTPHVDDPDLLFAMVVARFVNWPDTLAELGYPVPWNAEHFLTVLNARKARREVCFGSAYNISNGGRTTPKAEHLVQRVFTPLWQPLTRRRLRPHADYSLHEFYGRLKTMSGFESFMAAQIVADMKYVPPLNNARDWMTFAAPGPGSKRGLNRVLGRPVDAPWRDDDMWRATFRQLREQIKPELERIGLGDLHAQDLQNCSCEFDKFERVRLGEGKPKRRFVPR
jgi:alpha-glutamyl/putrescinyl thymine pyrophosphorylase clade 1